MKILEFVHELCRAAKLARPKLIFPDTNSINFWASTLEARGYTTQQATNARLWILHGKWWDAKNTIDLTDFTPTLEQLRTAANEDYITVSEHLQKVKRALKEQSQSLNAIRVFDDPQRETALRAEIITIGRENVELQAQKAQLKTQIERLQKHIERKDEQIERLQHTISAKTEALNRYNRTFHEV